MFEGKVNTVRHKNKSALSQTGDLFLLEVDVKI